MSRHFTRLLPTLLWLAVMAGLAVILTLLLRGTPGQKTGQAPEPTPASLTTDQPTVTLTPTAFDSPVETPTPEATETLVATPTPPPVETPTPTPDLTPTPFPGDEPIPIEAAPTGEAILYEAYRQVADDVWAGSIRLAPLDDSEAPVESIPIVFPVDFDPILDSISPDGRYALLLEPNFPGGTPYVYDRETNEVKPLFDNYPWVGGIGFDWSPDSGKIVFWAIDVGLWLIDVETVGKTLLTVPDGSVQRASISPSGQQVSFIASSQTSHRALWVINAAGGEPQWVLDINGPTRNPGWSTEGILYFEGAMGVEKGEPPDIGALWTTDAEGKQRRNFDVPIVFGLAFEPRLSPDRTQIAFTGLAPDESYDCSEAEELRNCIAPFLSIYVLDIRTGQTINLGKGVNPTWFPDGKRLVFVSYRTGSSEVWIVNTDGTGLRQLTNDGLSREIAWWLKGRE